MPGLAPSAAMSAEENTRHSASAHPAHPVHRLLFTTYFPFSLPRNSLQIPGQQLTKPNNKRLPKEAQPEPSPNGDGIYEKTAS